MQTATLIPPKGLWSLQLRDFWKGFIKSCGGLIIGIVIKMIQNHFHLPSYDEIEPLFEATAYFFFGYIGVNFATNNVGQIMQKDKPVVAVDKDQLDKLQKN